MNSNELENAQPSELLRRVTRAALPLALKDEISEELDANCTTNSEYIPQAAVQIVGAYRFQGAEACSRAITLAQVAATVFAFASVTTPFGVGVVLMALFCVMFLHDSYNHEGAGSNRDGVRQATTLSFLYGVLRDCAVAAVSVLGAQALLLTMTPDQIGPRGLLLRATIVFVPLLAALRIVVRQDSSGNRLPPRLGSTPAKLYHRIFVLNVLWMAACYCVLMTNWILVPDFMPDFQWQFLLTFIHVLCAVFAIFCVELLLPALSLVHSGSHSVVQQGLTLAALALLVVRFMARAGLRAANDDPKRPARRPAASGPYCQVCCRRHPLDPALVAGCPAAAEWLTFIREVDEKIRPARKGDSTW